MAMNEKARDGSSSPEGLNNTKDLEGQDGSRRGSRIDGPVVKGAKDGDMTLEAQIDSEQGNTIQYRTCSWQKTAALLFSEYICLAIMSFPWSYSILGLVPGLILTVIVAMAVLYTSLITWEFCLRHPEVRDVCDIGQMLFWNQRWAWYATAVLFLLNNTFIQGFHCLVGAEYINTMAGPGYCSVGWAALLAAVAFFCSLPRTFDTLSKLATASAFFTFISVLLAAIFAGIQDHPAGWKASKGLDVLVIPAAGTTFVDGMNAFLNISYTFIGQITLPSFIAEMREPKDFPKALWAVTIAEILVFAIVGAVVYGYVGTNYVIAPAFGSLVDPYKKIAFSFMIPTLVFLGVLYASVSARFLFFRIFKDSKHMTEHTVKGWATWAGILACTWVCAFIVAEVIPFFSDLLSLMSALFDSFFGWIFWGTAYIRMRQADYGPNFWRVRGIRGMAGAALNVSIITVGIFFLGPGTYATVQSIVDGYRTTGFGGPFSCAYTGL